MKEKLYRFFFTASINMIIGIPSIIIMVLLFVIVGIPDKNTTIVTLKNILIPVMFLFAGCMGIPMIIRQEAPGFIGNGEKAVIQGYALLIGCSLIAVLYVLSLIFLH